MANVICVSYVMCIYMYIAEDIKFNFALHSLESSLCQYFSRLHMCMENTLWFTRPFGIDVYEQ